MSGTMRAAVLHSPGNLVVESVAKPELKNSADVLIKVAAVGVCGSDLERVMVTGTYSMPLIPGHEFCGVVESAGEDADGFSPGDRVVVAPILPCMKCENCAKGDYGLCVDYNYLGSRTNGGMAEYVVAPSANLIKLPQSIGFEQGAAIEPAAVTLHGVMRTGIEAGDSVVVLGCGTIGLYAVQFARILGATKIIAVDIDSKKFELAQKFGASVCIDPAEKDVEAAVAELTGSVMADVVMETAGSSVTQEQSIRLARKKGRVLFLGTAHRDVVLPPQTFERIVRGELSMTGSWNSYSAPFPGREWHAVIAYAGSGLLDIASGITQVIQLEELPDMISKMSRREIAFNKVVAKL